MTFKSRLIITAGIATLCLGGIAYANPAADADQDGRISKSEFMAAANDRFINTDTNGDALISEDERKAHREVRRSNFQQKRFDQFDQNGDGVITRSEYEAQSENRSERRKMRRDVNKDGQVDRADRDEFREKMRERRKDRDGKRRGRINPDANSDGFVSRAEHDAATQAMFERLDVNQDGYLEKGEGRQMRKKKRRRH